MKRRSFLIASASGITLLALTACFPTEPRPTHTPAQPPTPTPPSGVPEPLRMTRSNWGGDPFARGARSFPSVDSGEEQRSLLRRSLSDRLYFAGEATASDAPGTVHGALGSGLRAALEIADSAERGERIAVIGAGIAGLTAARALREAGFEVVVVEARDRIGGRIQSVTDPKWPIPLELGSLFVSESSSVLAGQLALAGVSTEPFAPSPEVRAAGGEVISPSDAGANAVASASAWAVQQPEDSSLAAALIDSGAAAALSAEPAADGIAQTDWLAHELAAALEPAAGTTADLVSARLSDRLVADNTAGAAIVTGSPDGLGGLVDATADGLDILVGSPVATVIWGDDGVSLRLAQGESMSADRVLMTIPLGVLQQESTLFEPPLPGWKLEAIAGIGMGTVDSVWLQFDEAFWATDATTLSTIATDSAIAYWTNLQPLTGEAILVGTIAAERAAELAALSDAAFSAVVLESLRPFAPDPTAPGPTAPAPSSAPAPS